MTYPTTSFELNFWRIGVSTILFFKTCSAASSISLVSWFFLFILNISVNLVYFQVHAEMTHLHVCNLKESYSSMQNNFWRILQSIFNTFNNFSYTPYSVISHIWLLHLKHFAECLSCPLRSFAMHIKQNACLQGFNTSSLLSMLLQMLHMHIDKSGFHFSLKYEVSISIGRLSGGHFALSISRSSWDQSNFEIDGRPLRSIILMFLIFPRAPLLNSVTLTYV